jgi:putative ABC transport system permease protein
MLKNYFRITIRGFWKHRLFTLINIVGLFVGISAALVIYLIVHYDLTFDKFQKNGDRIYRVVTNFSFSGSPSYNAGVCGPLTITAGNQVTGLEAIAPIFELSQPNVLVPKNNATPSVFKSQDNVTLADGGYFNLFEYRWLAGNAKSALNEPFQIVLTSDQAAKYFPDLSYDQMIGRTVIYDSIKTTVTGIVQTIRKNTDFIFHDFISFSTALANKDLKAGLHLHNWGGTNSQVQLFVKLSPHTAVSNIQQQLNDILKKNSTPRPGVTQQFDLQPLADIHFNANYGTFANGRVADKTTLYELEGIGLFLLLLGCINFINLTTAQSVQRAKEIGIRKTLGSSRRQLILQFLSETFLIVLIAVIISTVMAPMILKLFSRFIPAGINANLIEQPDILIFLSVLTIMVSLLSGFYPALVLSGYKPVSVLKKQVPDHSGQTRNAMLRKSLTVTQFVIALFFIMATVLVSKQIYYALHKDLGFKKDAIVIINSPFKNRRPDLNRVLLNKLQSIPQIEMVSEGYDAPISDWPQSTEGAFIDGKKEIKFENLAEKFGDENYIKVYHIKLLAGRNLRNGDTSKVFLINNTLAKLIGCNDPQEAVGKMIDKFNGDTRMQIIGVVADFHQESIHSPVAPLVIFPSSDPGMNGSFHIALKPQTAKGNEWYSAIAGMKNAWNEVYPGDDFDYHFFDESIAKLYVNEQNTVSLLNWATGLSVLISCLGLLGLAIYTSNQRTKEIGVRKVLGASVTQIVVLLSTELIWLILLAFLIVSPIAWWAMNNWMQSFADRTAISWWIFVLSGVGMLLVAMLTCGFQTVRAALANPSKSLKTD